LALQLRTGADGGDLVSLDEQRAVLDDLIPLAESGKGGVGDEKMANGWGNGVNG